MSDKDTTGIDALFQNSDSPAWRELMDKAEESAPMKRTLEPAIYGALFGSDAGRKVLEDMYNRYVNVSRAVPGQGAEAAFYREGMAQVVFDIVDNINLAHSGEDK